MLVAALAGLTLAGAASADATPPALAAQLNHPVAPALMQQLERASNAGLRITRRPAANYIKPIEGPRLGKPPVLLYIGADYCPYCAAQRWGLALTLLRFGQLSGVQYMLSSATDVFANTATFTFQFARYNSPYLRFQAIETANREQQQLMPMTAQTTQIFKTFDVPPYVQFAYGIPFVYLNGAYLLTQPMISPASLQGMDWQQIAVRLADPRSALFAQIMPQVNAFTAAICRVDGNQPKRVCAAPGVMAANAGLSDLDGIMAR
jgi:thiol-disulfide isomerase/thioredoxin